MEIPAYHRKNVGTDQRGGYGYSIRMALLVRLRFD